MNASDAEEKFVMDSMKAGEGTARALASLLRTGAVKKAVMKELSKDRHKLGRLLPDGCGTFHDLPKSFIWNLFWRLVKGKAEVLTEDFTISDKKVKAKLAWALNIDQSAFLPNTHAHKEFEAPMAEVLVMQYNKYKRLEKVTAANLASKGYWAVGDQGASLIYVPKDEKFTSRVSKEELSDAKDWEIVNPESIDGATLSSTTLGYSRKCMIIYKLAKLVNVTQPLTQIPEAPEAVTAEMKAVLVHPEFLESRPKGRAKGKAKGKAKSAVKAPKRPTMARPLVTA
jgi:hypothetical protein